MPVTTVTLEPLSSMRGIDIDVSYSDRVVPGTTGQRLVVCTPGLTGVVVQAATGRGWHTHSKPHGAGAPDLLNSYTADSWLGKTCYQAIVRDLAWAKSK